MLGGTYFHYSGSYAGFELSRNKARVNNSQTYMLTGLANPAVEKRLPPATWRFKIFFAGPITSAA
jgi:hypothetical protein